ncbi:DUF3141 domain-containing protein [Desulfococcaceae bacterium HSG8]|nr:DUF3141 domain-containing protein [Desulfococcaceae bacterium HSG8]
MNTVFLQGPPLPASGLVRDGFDYWVDAAQRSVLFMDVLRKRGNIYLEHQRKGQPPVLTFEYKVIFDGRTLERPVNHDLVRIIPKSGISIDQDKRPIVVIDPRAGHGPGIGGSKQDSEIGVAVKEGHPVYFVVFYPEPCPGQTLSDVQQAEIRFVEEVKNRHPRAEEPAVIGNCQAGWAVALLSASRPDVTGPLVVNGSPFSYWSGVDGENPMRYKGGLLGGIWLASLFSDLGNGKFDGANLVANFEDLNPANTYWTKQYNVWANVDKEEERYLNFEKWWNGYFFMTSEEIRFIVSNLFVGNKLEQGTLELNEGEKIDLKKLEDPMVVFASKGDNITPPQQALNWIAKVYGTADEIKRYGQVIIYRVHDSVGHLGIFVSGSVAKKEHKEIIGSIDMIDYLPPGLYEMVIEEKGKKYGVTDYKVRFEERDISDILAMDDGQENEEEFPTVAAVSEINDKFYHTALSPWVRTLTTEYSAEIMRQLHHLRVSRYAFSDLNPLILPFKPLGPIIKKHRRPVSPDNTFLKMEKCFSDSIAATLDYYRDMRDDTSEFFFKFIYGSPWTKMVLSKPGEKEPTPEEVQEDIKEREEREEREKADERKRWLSRMEEGGFPEGIVRIMVAMADANHIFDENQLIVAEKIVKVNKRLRKLDPGDFKRMVKEQSRMLDIDEERAINALPKLLPTPDDRIEAFEIANSIATADLDLVSEEEALLERIKGVLDA